MPSIFAICFRKVYFIFFRCKISFNKSLAAVRCVLQSLGHELPAFAEVTKSIERQIQDERLVMFVFQFLLYICIQEGFCIWKVKYSITAQQYRMSFHPYHSKLALKCCCRAATDIIIMIDHLWYHLSSFSTTLILSNECLNRFSGSV